MPCFALGGRNLEEPAPIPGEESESILGTIKWFTGISLSRGVEVATLLAVLLTACMAFLTWQSTRQDGEDADWVARTHVVQTALQATVAHAADIETGARAFATTGNDVFLEPYWSGQRAVVKDISMLHKAILDKAQQERLNLLEQQIDSAIALKIMIVDERRRTGAIPLDINRVFLEGKHSMDAVRATVAEMQGSESTLLDLRMAATARSRSRTRVIVLSAAIVGMAFLLIAGFFLRRESNHTVQINQQLKTLNVDLKERTRESRQAEEETRVLNRDLEERVRIRTAEITRVNTKLTESAKELEAFAYSVSHDLRAPLRHLDGFLSLLSKRSYSNLDDSAKHYVDCTLEASKRMGQLIDDLLQFSRLGRDEIHKAPVDLNDIVEQVRKELEPETRDRSIHWKLSHLPEVAADQAMLRQVIENFVANALKFTRHCPTAEIEIGCKPEPTGEVVFFIRDNGVGFDMRYYSKLFEIFQRLHGEQEFEGTGIGLAIVRRVVERHGGRVWAEGAVGAGATFYFSLPTDSSCIRRESSELEANLVS
jgi:signal transduction histidine kinase